MLFIGQQRQRTCQTLTRRAFLQAGGSTVLGLPLWLSAPVTLVLVAMRC